MAGSALAEDGVDAWRRACAPVGMAVRDLMATHGERYRGGGGWLERLEALAEGDFPGLDALRREALLANPLLAEQPMIYVVRPQFAPDHHNTETFFQTGEINTASYRPGGAIKVWNPADGSVTTLLEAGEGGLLRDPELSYDGRRVIFSWRKDIGSGSSVWEIAIDGSGLRQLTRDSEVNDIDPVYLPDGSVVFSSTREPKYCMCNRHLMGNLFRMESDGANIHQIGRSTLFEGHPTVLSDGRILYDRWEYVDRNFGDAQALWTVNPDGTAHAIHWGSNVSSPGAVIDAREVPGSEWVVAVFAACHDRPWGALALIDRQAGVDRVEAVLHTWPADARGIFNRGGFDSTVGMPIKYEDPYPLSSKHVLCVRQLAAGSEATGIFLVDVFGNEVLVHAEAPGCFDPLPVRARPLPRVIPDRRDEAQESGTFYVRNANAGTHMEGVAPGEARYLRVVESPEKRSFSGGMWGGQGAQHPAMNWHNFENKRILGTVPVEPDGSAYFEVPANRYVFFQVLDAKGRMIQSMRSGTIIQPGETQGCVGCHDTRTGTPAADAAMAVMRKPPAKLEGWLGPAREFSFLDEVQPVFDRHCVSCHDFQNPRNGGLILAGDRELVFNAAYTELWSKGMVRAVGAGPAEIQAARSWGAAASRLVQLLDQGHHDVRLSDEEMARIVTWIDLNAPYYPYYETGFSDGIGGRSPLDLAQHERIRLLTGVDLAQGASHDRHRLWVSFDRPEMSPLLDRLPAGDAAARGEVVAILTGVRDLINRQPRGDRGQFVPGGEDARRVRRYVERAKVEAANREAIREGRKRYDGGEIR